MLVASFGECSFFFLKIYRVLLYDLAAMRGFVGSDLGREPVPDVLMVAI
jgi:hypothetical protein